MVSFTIKIIVIIAIISSGHFCPLADSGAVTVASANSNGLDESPDLFTDNLQNSYQASFLQLAQFFKSTNAALDKVNQRLERLEKVTEMLEKSNQRHDIALMKFHQEYRDSRSEDYVRSLSPTKQGQSFRNPRVDRLYSNHALALEIVNYLDFNLTDYQLDLISGSQTQPAPASILSKTREIFTFEHKDDFLRRHYLAGRRRMRPKHPQPFDDDSDNEWHIPFPDSQSDEHQPTPTTTQSSRGPIFPFERSQEDGPPKAVLLYRIGDTGFSLHLYFSTRVSNIKGRFGAGLLDNNMSVKTIGRVDGGCENYNHNTTWGDFRCIEIVQWDPSKTFVIRQGSVYAKVSMDFQWKISKIKVELFQIDLEFE